MKDEVEKYSLWTKVLNSAKLKELIVNGRKTESEAHPLHISGGQRWPAQRLVHVDDDLFMFLSVLNNLTVVPYFLLFLMTVFTVFHGALG